MFLVNIYSPLQILIFRIAGYVRNQRKKLSGKIKEPVKQSNNYITGLMINDTFK